jgi:lambda repressor-like predicted transcriptional regulator
MTREQLRALTQRQLARSGLSLRAYARHVGCQASHLSEFLRHGRRPVPKVVEALGYRLKGDEYERA